MSTIPAPDPGPTLRRVDILPGQVLMNRYEVLRVLGRGAMGEVLEVRDRASGLSYALKRVPPELVRDKAQMKAIQANFALVSQLAHPHIATTRHLEVDASTGHAYLIMELVHGIDMQEWLSRRRATLGHSAAPLPMAEIVGICEQIAAALDYAHAQPVARGADGKPSRYGLLHRDLKPANVMIETARDFRPGVPYVKLVDFGLAAEIQASLHERSIQARRENAAGTLLYMAPEQWEGRTLTRGIDQWALAVVMYDMAAGRKPFNAVSSEALYLQVKRADPERPVALSPAQWQVFQKAFSPDRRGRYRSCMAFVKALAAADVQTAGSVVSAELPMPDEFQGVPETGEPAPVPETLVSKPAIHPKPVEPRRSAWPAVAFAAVLLLFLGGGYQAWKFANGGLKPEPAPGPQPNPAPAPEPAPKKDGGIVWKPLRLVWDNKPAFEVWISGTALRNEGAARSGVAPVGGWIELSVLNEGGEVYHELKWDGQPEIHLRSSGEAVEWSEPGGAWKVLGVDERRTTDLGNLGLEAYPDLTAPSMVIQDPGVPGMLDLMKHLRPVAITCLHDDHLDLLAQVPTLRRVNLTRPAQFTLNDLWRLKQLTAIDLGVSDSIASLQGIQDCTELEVLYVSNCPHVADLSPIASLKHLRELALPAQTTAQDLRTFRESGALDGLVFLSLNSATGLQDLSFLRGLKNLSGLTLNYCDNILEFDPLDSVPPLRYLGLPAVTASDLDGMRKRGRFENLLFLTLSAKNLESLDALSGLPDLCGLTITEVDKLANLAALKDLPNLRELRLYGALPAKAYEDLAAVRRLRVFTLPQLTDEQLQGLQRAGTLAHVVSLDLTGSPQLNDEGPLTQMKNLKRLNLTGCTGLLATVRLQNLEVNLPGCEILGIPTLAPKEEKTEAPPGEGKKEAEAELIAPISFVLRDLPVAVGTHLKKGAPFGQITGPNLRVEHETAVARMNTARTASLEAKRQFERQQKLRQEGLVTQEDFEKAAAASKQAEADFGLAQKRAAALQDLVDRGGVTMPFDGVVVKYLVEIGQAVEAGQPFVTVRKDP